MERTPHTYCGVALFVGVPLPLIHSAHLRRYDHLLFHEADFPDAHKIFLQSTVPSTPLRFINVQAFFDAGRRYLDAQRAQVRAEGATAARARARELGAKCWVDGEGTDRDYEPFYKSKEEFKAFMTDASNTEACCAGYKTMCHFWFSGFLEYARPHSNPLLTRRAHAGW
jgi:hypothetical protein